jgi:EmrB/QacA subfamily drug resistance transporter
MLDARDCKRSMAGLISADTPYPITHDKVLVVFSGLLLVMLLAALDSTIVATALPTIVGEMGGLAHLSWVVTAYLLAETVVTPLYGKLGDIYGRKGVLQTAIVLFLLGSALCGMSRSMTQLILFRAVQGLGGGGLIVTTQAVVGDIVAPRDRGRYQGIFGAVFGAASIIGPLVGGYFTTHLTWRWIFYINLPVGIIALVVLAATLPARANRVRHSIDYTGAALLAIALSSIILVTDLGGTEYPWSSPMMLGLIGAAVVSLLLFLLVESRVDEPILPLRLFLNRAVWVTSGVGLIVGFALFGSVTYLPLFLQVVKGVSPTASGLEMLPLMGGSLVTSIISGQLISRTGRYKAFPIAGTACTTLGLYLLSRMSTETSTIVASLIMLVLGLGLGLVMQVLVIAVQNAVNYRDLGVATSGATLFRLIGGSIGTAVLGAIFASRLTANLSLTLPPGTEGSSIGTGINQQMLADLPEAVRVIYAHAFTASLSTVFLFATTVALLGFLLTWLLPERPLRETIAAATEGDIGGDVGQAFAMPPGTDPLVHVQRGLAVLANRNETRQYIERIISRAGVDLSPAAAWLLGRLEKDSALQPANLARAHRIDPEVINSALSELLDRRLITETNSDNGKNHPLTHEGCVIFNQLAEARRAYLAELWPEWSPEKREEVADLIRRLARQLVPDSNTGRL